MDRRLICRASSRSKSATNSPTTSAGAKGKHLIKFGAAFEHVQDNVNYLSNRYGSYTYPTVTSFALDYTGNTAGAQELLRRSARPSAIRIVDFAIKDIGIYLQDQWKATDRLTVTLGLRYEYTIAPPPPTANPLYPLTGAARCTPAPGI